MSEESFTSDPEDVFGLGDVILTAFSQWAGEWYCTPWTNKPHRVVMGYVCKHRRGNRPDHYVYLMPLEDSGLMAMMSGRYGDPTIDDLVFSWSIDREIGPVL